LLVFSLFFLRFFPWLSLNDHIPVPVFFHIWRYPIPVFFLCSFPPFLTLFTTFFTEHADHCSSLPDIRFPLCLSCTNFFLPFFQISPFWREPLLVNTLDSFGSQLPLPPSSSCQRAVPTFLSCHLRTSSSFWRPLWLCSPHFLLYLFFNFPGSSPRCGVLNLPPQSPSVFSTPKPPTFLAVHLSLSRTCSSPPYLLISAGHFLFFDEIQELPG